MPARIGLELAPSVCRIVELDAPLVRSFSVFPSSDRAVLEAFRSLGRRRASVIVWDAPNDHRQVVVTDGPYEIATRLAGNLAEFVRRASPSVGGGWLLHASPSSTDASSAKATKSRVLGWSRSGRTVSCSGTARAGSGA